MRALTTPQNELPSGKIDGSEDRRGRALAKIIDADTIYNIYYFKKDSRKGETVIENNRQNGVDVNSRAIDPVFVDPENGNFNFKPGSPAIEMGIAPFDMSKVGLRN